MCTRFGAQSSQSVRYQEWWVTFTSQRLYSSTNSRQSLLTLTVCNAKLFFQDWNEVLFIIINLRYPLNCPKWYFFIDNRCLEIIKISHNLKVGKVMVSVQTILFVFLRYDCLTKSIFRFLERVYLCSNVKQKHLEGQFSSCCTIITPLCTW